MQYQITAEDRFNLLIQAFNETYGGEVVKSLRRIKADSDTTEKQPGDDVVPSGPARIKDGRLVVNRYQTTADIRLYSLAVANCIKQEGQFQIPILAKQEQELDPKLVKLTDSLAQALANVYNSFKMVLKEVEKTDKIRKPKQFIQTKKNALTLQKGIKRLPKEAHDLFPVKKYLLILKDFVTLSHEEPSYEKMVATDAKFKIVNRENKFIKPGKMGFILGVGFAAAMAIYLLHGGFIISAGSVLLGLIPKALKEIEFLADASEALMDKITTWIGPYLNF